MRASLALSVLVIGLLVIFAGCAADTASDPSVPGDAADSNGSVESDDGGDAALADYAVGGDSESGGDEGGDASAEEEVKLFESRPELPPTAEHSAPMPVPRPDEGIGPGESGDKYDHITENEFLRVNDSPLSTFSIDVDTASYSKTRMYLMQQGHTPPPDAVRVEELVNYFSYDYAGPKDEHPFAAHVEVAECPWQPAHRLARVGIKGREIEADKRQRSNLVFLIDRSGSMRPENKLPLLKRGMLMLAEQLVESDMVSIVAYAGSTQTILPPTPGDQWVTISNAINQLSAGGATAGSAGLELAYNTAHENFIQDGVNRVILCTDGDFNVGRTSPGELVRQVEEHAKKNIFMTVLGFGMGNHNDSMLEQISNKGNGNYAFVDTQNEARKVLVQQMSGTLVTIAKDVKIQIEFNPAKVAAYRLIGYENRKLADEDFNDDKKDAGEIGAGHRVTALYEIVPVGAKSDVLTSKVDDLKYQKKPDLTAAAERDELLTLKLRYKQPEGDKSTLMTFAVEDSGKRFGEATTDFKFASAVASFGMLLRGSQFKGNLTYDAVLEIAGAAKGKDEFGYRDEFVRLVERARNLPARR